MMRNYQMIVILFTVLTSAVVRSDYPPPSEDGHEYYSYKDNSDNSRHRTGNVGGGRGMSFVGDWSKKDWSILTNYNQPKCLDIPSNLTLCRNIGYGQMRLPNLLEHETLKEVTQQANTWVQLTQIGCHPDTQIFLCSLFAPICLDQPVWPCQTLCEAVKSGCEGRMLQNGFPWPDMLRCDKFPTGTEVCIGVRDERSKDEVNVGAETCSACSLAESLDEAMSTFCRADFVLRAKVEQSLVTGNDLKVIVSKKKKVFKPGSLKAKELREGVVYLNGGAKCDCQILDTVNGQRTDGHVIIAGNRTGDQRLAVTMIQNVRSKGVRRILREMRKKDPCKPGRMVKGKKKGTGKSKNSGEGGRKKTKEVKDKATKEVTKPSIKNLYKGNRVSEVPRTTATHATQVPKQEKERPQGSKKQRQEGVSTTSRTTKKAYKKNQ